MPHPDTVAIDNLIIHYEGENSRRGGGEGGGGADEGKDGKDTHRYEVEVDGGSKKEWKKHAEAGENSGERLVG